MKYAVIVNGIPTTTADGRIARMSLEDANRIADALYEKDASVEVSVVYAD